MKVAIMTQPLGKNFGGIMQAWALQKVLIDEGHYPVTIDRQPVSGTPFYRVAKGCVYLFLKAIGRPISLVRRQKNQNLIFKKPKEFIAENIVMSEPIYSTGALRKHFSKNEYDVVIVGSDQTWRPSYSPNIYNFYLDFTSKLKLIRVAYASSFGVDFWEYTDGQTARCRELIKYFNSVSVRETTGVELCKRFFDVAADVVLDPTLLIEKTDYLKLIGHRLSDISSGVYMYFLDRDDDLVGISNRISSYLNEPTYSCQAKFSSRNQVSKNLNDYIMPDVKDWLAGFANSSFVVTDSFHGMVFSIIFEKPFIAIVNEGRGAARFCSLAENVGVRDRVIMRADISKLEDLSRFFDPPQINLDMQRRKSRYFLRESFS